MTKALMWEAVAAENRLDDLVHWARSAASAAGAANGLVRAEVFAAPDDRVVVITWWDRELPSFDEPPQELLHRPAHSWVFDSIEVVSPHG